MVGAVLADVVLFTRDWGFEAADVLERVAADGDLFDGDLAEASRLLYGEIPAMEKQLEEADRAAREADVRDIIHTGDTRARLIELLDVLRGPREYAS